MATKKLEEIGSNRGVILDANDLQGMRQALKDGSLLVDEANAVNKILQSSSDIIKVTADDLDHIFDVLSQIDDKNNSTLSSLQSLNQSITATLASLTKGYSTLKDVLRTGYQLRNVVDSIRVSREGGDLWGYKDLVKAEQKITQIQNRLRSAGNLLGLNPNDFKAISDGNLAKIKDIGEDLKAITSIQRNLTAGSGIMSFDAAKLANQTWGDELTGAIYKSLKTDSKGDLMKVGANRSNYIVDPDKISVLLKDLDEASELLKKQKETLTEYTDTVKASNEAIKEFTLSQETTGAVGSRNNIARTQSKLAGKLGLGDISDLISNMDAEATKAAKLHLTENEGDTAGAQAAYDKVYNINKIMPQIKRSFIETYLHLGKWGGPLGVALILIRGIWKSLLSIDEEAVKAKRVTGEWLEGVAIGQTRLVSGQEVLKTIVALSEQFAFNAANVFTPDELARIAEVQKLTGMSAEAAGNLAVQSKINGISTDRYRDSIAAGANQANRLNHSAVTLSAVQNEVLKTSNAIQLSYGKNVEGLARAAGAAKALGMSLQDVENISKNLMNFESSIGAEMQAQLLTGRQLNLAKAREYALNNDLEGVAKEIGRQGITAASFSKMNYIQQEAMAKALGMSREEMSKMLVMQMINKGLSAEQVAAATHMKKEDIEALSAQEKWQTMKQKFLTSLVPLLEPILQFVSGILNGVSWLMGGLSWIITWGGKAPTAVRYIMAAILVGTGLVIRSWIRGRGILASMNGLALRLAKSLQLAFTGSWFDRGVGRWRNAAGQFTAAPRMFGRGAGAGAGASNSMGGVQKAAGGFGKNAGNLVKGAFAMVLIAGAMWILAKAVQEFSKVTWDDMLKAGVALAVFAGVAIGVAYALKAAGSALIEAGIYLAIFGVALIPLAFALRLLAPLVEAIGKAIKSVLEGIGTVITSVCEGITKMLTEITLERAAGFMMIALTLPLFGVGLGLAAISMLFFPVKKFTRFMEALGQLKGLGSVASTIRTIADAIGYLADKVSNLSGKDLRALTKVLKSLKGVGLNISTGESAGMTRETLGDTVSVSAVSSNATQAGEQQSSVSKTDLTEVSKKMDRIIEAILSCKPSDWHWIEFHRAYVSNVPDAARGGV